MPQEQSSCLTHAHHRFGVPLPQRIAVVRALPGLGDLLCAVPAWRALRAALPEAHITLVGLPSAQSIVERFRHYLDQLIVLPGFPGLPEQTPLVRQLPAFFAQVQQEQFDLALQMHGSGGVTNILTALLGARVKAGFFLPDQYCPDSERFLQYPTHEPEVRRHLRLLEFLGVPLQGDHLEFPLWEDDWQVLQSISEACDLQPGTYICVHPGASTESRRWSLDQFAAIADDVAQQGLQVVLTGVAHERELVESAARTMQSPSINLAGRTSLGALAALLHGARLLLCNDTGVSHLASALQVPSVVIFSDSDVQRWAPLDRQRHRALVRPGGVSVEMVLAAVNELLWQEVPHVA
jgi:ADP-heptose:LPS heptosyltransferase